MGFHLFLEGLWLLVVSLPWCERGNRGRRDEGVEGVSTQKIVLLGLIER